MTTEEQYKYFQELDKKASQGGGVERVEKQHANGHMTARERIDMLLDKGTFNSSYALMTAELCSIQRV